MSFTQAATVLYVSQPARTAQIKKFKDALRSRLLGGRRRIMQRCRNASYRIRIRCSSTCRRGRWSAAAWMQIAALPRLSFNRLPAVFRGKGVRLRSLRAIGTRLNGVLGFESKCVPALLHRDDHRISFWSYHSNQPPLYVRLAGVGRPVHVRSLVGWRIRTDRKTRLYGH
jgi:hypothetical protein